MHLRIILALIAGGAALFVIACGSDSVASGPASGQAVEGPAIVRADDTFTLDSVVSAGWKKSKQLSAELLQGTDEVWYGFFQQKDIEIRFYASHEEAVALGVDPAEEAIGKPAQSAEAGGKLDQSRARTGYDAFVIVGNLVMLCELEVATCEALISQLK